MPVGQSPGEPQSPIEGDCEFCEEPAVVRHEIRYKSGLGTGMWVNGCRKHDENAKRLADARRKPSP